MCPVTRVDGALGVLEEVAECTSDLQLILRLWLLKWLVSPRGCNSVPLLVSNVLLDVSDEKVLLLLAES
jgi:hypothetical protein